MIAKKHPYSCLLAKGRAYYKKKQEEGFTRVVANGKSFWMKKEEYK